MKNCKLVLILSAVAILASGCVTEDRVGDLPVPSAVTKDAGATPGAMTQSAAAPGSPEFIKARCPSSGVAPSGRPVAAQVEVGLRRDLPSGQDHGTAAPATKVFAGSECPPTD